MATVLVVDDSEAVRLGLSRLLTLHGFVPALAGTGGDALAAAARTRPDLILLDLALPDMDGLAFLARLAADRPELAGVPVVVFSALDDNEVRWQASRLGVVEYVTKGPVGWDEMVGHVRRHLPGGGG